MLPVLLKGVLQAEFLWSSVTLLLDGPNHQAWTLMNSSLNSSHWWDLVVSSIDSKHFYCLANEN